jgi:hypothetical protein
MSSATDVLIELVRRLDAGRYEDALALWDEDPRVRDGITMDQFREHLDRRITRGRTVADVQPVSETDVPERPGDVRARIRITYRDGATHGGDLIVTRVGGDWRVTSHGSLV